MSTIITSHLLKSIEAPADQPIPPPETTAVEEDKKAPEEEEQPPTAGGDDRQQPMAAAEPVEESMTTTTVAETADANVQQDVPVETENVVEMATDDALTTRDGGGSQTTEEPQPQQSLPGIEIHFHFSDFPKAFTFI